MPEIKEQLEINKGKIDCDKRILLSIISLATKEISGVSRLQDSFSMKFKRIFTHQDSQGVKIKFSSNGKLVVDVYVKIFSGNSVPDIAFRIQENIKNNISSMVEMSTSKINVHILGVDFAVNTNMEN